MADEQAEAIRKRLAEDKERSEKSRELAFEKMKYRPTPTQEENDRAALGEHITEHEPDGSPEEDRFTPDLHGGVHGASDEERRRAREARAQEAKPQAQRGYETRTVQPRPQPGQKPE